MLNSMLKIFVGPVMGVEPPPHGGATRYFGWAMAHPKMLWVGHNAFGPPKKCRCKIKYSYCFQCLRNFFCQLPFGFHCPTD
jgi:hypothetical protein